MKRRAPDEPVAKFRRRTAEREAAAIAAVDWTDVPIATEADVPDELNDRAADGWEPLIALAKAAGGDWPGRAWQAAIGLSSDDESPVSVGIRLLTDIRDAFDGEDHLTTAVLLARLHALDDAPWADWYGQPLSARGLAKLLDPYRVSPAQRRVHGEKARGYFRVDFLDAWARYAPPGGPVPSVPSVPARHNGTDGTDETVPETDEDDYPPSDLWTGVDEPETAS